MNQPRVVRITPQYWDRDYAVDLPGNFTFEVTTALAALQEENPALAEEVESALDWHEEIERWWEDAITSGQVPMRAHDGPSRAELLDEDWAHFHQVDYPEASGEAAIA